MRRDGLRLLRPLFVWVHTEELSSREPRVEGRQRYLATQLGTSDNQIQRLLDPSILNKNLEQLYRIALLLGLELEWRVRAAT
jgi:hypothetical protein